MNDSTFLKVSHSKKQTRITLWSKEMTSLSELPFDDDVFLEKVLPNIISASCFSEIENYSSAENMLLQHLLQQKLSEGLRKASFCKNGRITVSISKKDLNFFKKNWPSLPLSN